MMAEHDQRPSRRRMILRVSSRRDVESGLPVALELAAAFHVEVEALFVEDEASIAASALPFPTVVGFAGRTMAPGATDIEEAMRREVESCRRLLVNTAARARRAITFHHLRGEARRLMREASAEGDILALQMERIGLPFADTIAIASDLAPPGGGILLLPERPAAASGPILLIRVAGEPLDGIGELAADLARSMEAPLIRVEAGGDLADSPMAASARLIVVRIESPLVQRPERLARLAIRLRSPLLLMRTDWVPLVSSTF